MAEGDWPQAAAGQLTGRRSWRESTSAAGLRVLGREGAGVTKDEPMKELIMLGVALAAIYSARRLFESKKFRHVLVAIAWVIFWMYGVNQACFTK